MKRILAILTLFTIWAEAQTLTLKQCVDQALATHPDIQSFMLRLQQSEESVKSSRSAFLPQIVLHGNYDFQHTYALPVNGRFHTKDENGWSAGVGVRQKLWDFEKSSRLTDASKLGRAIAKARLQDARALMILRVRTAYLQLLVNRAAIDVYTKDLAAKQALYDQAKAMQKQGLKTGADALRFFAALEEAKDALSGAKSAYAQSKIALETLIGKSIPETVRFDAAPLANVAGQITIPNKATLMKTNPKLAVARLEAKADEKRYLAAKAQRYGSLDLVADLSHVDTLSAYDTKQAGVQYSAPIFSGGKLSAEAQKAKIVMQIAAENIEVQKRSVLETYRKLKTEIAHLKQSLKAQQARIAAAKESAKLLSARYKVGMSTYIQLLDTQSVLLKARLALLQTRFRLADTLNRLQYLTGKDDD